MAEPRTWNWKPWRLVIVVSLLARNFAEPYFGFSGRYETLMLGIVLVIEVLAFITVIHSARVARRQYREQDGPDRMPFLYFLLLQVHGSERLANYFFEESRLYAGFLRAVIFRSNPTIAGAYSATKGSNYPFVLPVFVFLIGVEATVTHVILQSFMDSGWMRTTILWVLGLSSGYLAVLLIGELKVLSESRTRLEAKHLHLDLGARGFGNIPCSQIARVSSGTVETEEDIQAKQIPRKQRSETQKQTRTLALIDTPNLRLEFTAPVALRSILGYGKPLTCQYLNLYLHDAEGFSNELRTRLTPKSDYA